MQSHRSIKRSEVSSTVHQISTGIIHQEEGAEDRRTGKGAEPHETLSIVN